jgi:hypothetical protein
MTTQAPQSVAERLDDGHSLEFAYFLVPDAGDPQGVLAMARLVDELDGVLAELTDRLVGCGCGEVLLGPAADLVERRQQRAPRFGQRVGDGDGRPFVDVARDEPGVTERAESVGEHRVADSVDGTSEGAEARRPAAQRAEDDPGPALAQEVERADERRVAAGALLGVDRRAALRRCAHGNKLATSTLLGI